MGFVEGGGGYVVETSAISTPVAVSPRASLYSLSIYPCGDLLAVGGSEMAGLGERRG